MGSDSQIIRQEEQVAQSKAKYDGLIGSMEGQPVVSVREDNKFLKRYTTSVSRLLDSVDEIISTCFQLGEIGWETCNNYYEDNRYVDWQNISQSAQKGDETLDTNEWSEENIYIGSCLVEKGITICQRSLLQE